MRNRFNLAFTIALILVFGQGCVWADKHKDNRPIIDNRLYSEIEQEVTVRRYTEGSMYVETTIRVSTRPFTSENSALEYWEVEVCKITDTAKVKLSEYKKAILVKKRVDSALAQLNRNR